MRARFAVSFVVALNWWSLADAATLDKAAIRETVGKIAVELRDRYVFPDKGDEAATALEKALATKAYDDLSNPEQLAQRLTADLRAVTNDSHMRVIYGSPFRNQPTPTAPQDAGFEVKRLEADIGYLRLSRFDPPETFMPAADDAMESLAGSDALIIDMRDNGGGHPVSVAYLASFLLDAEKPTQINSLIWRNRSTKTFRTETFWTSPTPVRYPSRPVYVLVGPKTYSAGEEFAYDLQVLKRATVVGAATRGGANPGGLTEVGPDLFVVLPTGRAENPITRGNWQGVGIIPDIQVDAGRALDTAVALANRHPDPTLPR
jgi:Peptidase family S41/N-terminal domain of Peptidase_S41 in eukaryotic IRBP